MTCHYRTLLLLVTAAAAGCETGHMHSGKTFLLERGDRYRQFDVTLVSVEPDGSAQVRWNKSGDTVRLKIDEAQTAPYEDGGFVRLLATHERAQIAVFETTWAN